MLNFVFYLDLCLFDRDFPRPVFGPNIGPFPIKKWAKPSQNGVYDDINNFLALHFGEKFMKILTKIAVTEAWKFA